ncbi:MAG: geranylgeranyl diphosphate reductase [Woeseiaceae bacterium]|nr:geranylgeranyl diphosphate reductase [Woeseiaceae bacterium]
MMNNKNYDVAVIGGGPAGSTAAKELAETGHHVLLLDRDGRIKPCGGAVPPILLREFGVPESQLETKVTGARMVAPSDKSVDMDIGGFVGMVDRATFDPWLRERASAAGADLVVGKFQTLEQAVDGRVRITYQPKGGDAQTITARVVIGADGAASRVREQAFSHQERMKHVFAYHEIVKSPESTTERFDPKRCDVYYQGKISPDFYGWVFPHGKCTSVGVGSAVKGFSLRNAVKAMRDETGLDDNQIIRREGAPLPLKPLKRWDNGKNVVLIGDAAGCVAPSSGEGIYYAMSCGRFATRAVDELLQTGDSRALKKVRKDFMKAHRMVFFILGVMQYYWYSSDKRREKFVEICRDPDVQKLTWDAYMNKQLVRAKPVAHIRIFFKDLAHLVGLNPS